VSTYFNRVIFSKEQKNTHIDIGTSCTYKIAKPKLDEIGCKTSRWPTDHRHLITSCALDTLDQWIGGLKITCDLLTSRTQKSGEARYLRVKLRIPSTRESVAGQWQVTLGLKLEVVRLVAMNQMRTGHKSLFVAALNEHDEIAVFQHFSSRLTF
jgi:hypothetical protein